MRSNLVIVLVAVVTGTLFLASASADKLKPEDYPPPPPVPAALKSKSKAAPEAKKEQKIDKIQAKSDTFNVDELAAPAPAPASAPSKKAPVKVAPKNSYLRPAASKTSVKPKSPIYVPSPPPPQNKRKKPTNLGKKKKGPPKRAPPPPPPPAPKKPKQTPEAQRRDSAYGAPAAPSYAPPKRQVIIKQAGPSKQYIWVGHGRYAPIGIRNPFPEDLPKWVPMGNNIFEAGLLYPGKPGSSSSSSSSYSPPPKAPAAPSYSAPAQDSYGSPPPAPAAPALPTYTSSASVDSYSAPAPAPATYSKPEPVYNPVVTKAPAPPPASYGFPAQPSYQSAPSQPTYGSSTLIGYEEPVKAVPAYTQAPVTAAPSYSAPAPAPAAPSYSAPAPAPSPPAYTTPQPSYNQPQQPSYSQPNQPFTVFGSQAHGSYSSPTSAPAAPSYQTNFQSAPATQAPVSYNVPDIQAVYEEPVGKPGNYPAFNSLPGFAGQTFLEPSQSNYEAQASIDTPSKAVPPVASNFFEVYDVPLKVEETYNANPQGDDQDIYYIFYEDKPESAPKQPPGGSNFSPPSGDDIKTIYVPYDNAVNVPDVFDISVGTSFGYNGQQGGQRQPPNPANAGSSYDNPISSFDAPIYDESSYTAAASNYDANSFSDTLFRENAGPLTTRKVRKPAVIDESVSGAEEQSVLFKAPILGNHLPYGTRIHQRKPYSILGL